MEFRDNPSTEPYYYIGEISEINSCSNFRALNHKTSKNLLSSKEAAEAHLALMQLHLLRDCYRQGWKPDWNNPNEAKHCIFMVGDTFMLDFNFTSRSFLSFQTDELSNKFLENFKDLIIKARELL